MIIVQEGEHYKKQERKAHTEWAIRDSDQNHSLLDVKINSGARHQIRLHLSSIGFPIVNDKLYNNKSPININLPHFLFAYRVTIPYYNDTIDVCVETPFSLVK
jgi:23S rRNA-/tRNA-specific pseudouridylate synthase